VLLGYEPLQGIHADFDHSLVITPPSCQDERLRQPSVRVGKTLLKPLPRLGMTFLIDIEEPIRKRIANALDSSVSWEPVQISLHARMENAQARGLVNLSVAGPRLQRAFRPLLKPALRE